MLRAEKDIENQEYKNFRSELQELKTSWVKDRIQVFAFLSAVLTFVAVLTSYLYLVSAGYFSRPETKQTAVNNISGIEMKHLYAVRDKLNTEKNMLRGESDSLQREIISKESTLKNLYDRTDKAYRQNNLLSNNYFLSKDSKDVLLQNKYIAEITALVNRCDEIVAMTILNDSTNYDPNEYFDVYQPAKIKILTALIDYRRTRHEYYLTEIDRLLPVLNKFTYPMELNLLQSEIYRNRIEKEAFINKRDSI